LPLSKTNRGDQQHPCHWSLRICYEVILTYKTIFLTCSCQGSSVSLHHDRMWSGLSWFSFPHITFYHVHVSSIPFYSCPVCLPYWPGFHGKYLHHHSYHINSHAVFAMFVIITRVLPLEIICFLVIKVYCSYFDVLSYQKGSVLSLWCCPMCWHDLQLVTMENSRNEGRVDPSHCSCMQVQAWSMDHKSCIATNALFGSGYSDSQITASLFCTVILVLTGSCSVIIHKSPESM
jgi:hypothetical protein